MTETKSPPKHCIIVHGGAGDVPLSGRDKGLCAVKEAVQIGYEALSEVNLPENYFGNLLIS